jgi:GDP-L-fucose synthase
MKKKLLVTGSTSFIGQNVLSFLYKSYNITSPKRSELNLVDKKNVDAYFSKNTFDILLHLAAPHPGSNSLDNKERLFDDMVRAFLNLEKHSAKFEKMLYTGSGAEYDKAQDIKMAKEKNMGKNIPEDPYGFAKYIMHTIAKGSSNIYNLRIFGCYGPGDYPHKFIYHVIDCCLKNKPITIRQDCYFDYLYVEDLVLILKWFIEHKPLYHDYNVTTGEPVSLSHIAELIAQKMENINGIKMLGKGWNKEYTASNERLLNEFVNFQFTSLNDGIDKQIIWQKGLL